MILLNGILRTYCLFLILKLASCSCHVCYFWSYILTSCTINLSLKMSFGISGSYSHIGSSFHDRALTVWMAGWTVVLDSDFQKCSLTHAVVSIIEWKWLYFVFKYSAAWGPEDHRHPTLIFNLVPAHRFLQILGTLRKIIVTSFHYLQMWFPQNGQPLPIITTEKSCHRPVNTQLN